MPKKIAVLISHGFEDEEYLQCVHAFSIAGHQCFTLGLDAASICHGLHTKTKLSIDQSLANIRLDAFDALLILGGQSPLHLAQKTTTRTFIRQCIDAKKIIFSLSSAPLLLLSADVLHERLISTQRPLAAVLQKAGAYYYDAEVVNDHNEIISCRGIDDLEAFIPECLEALDGDAFYPLFKETTMYQLYAH
jgi:protease I